MIVNWGVHKADELHLESLIEATETGRWLYEKHGYRCVTITAVDVTKKKPSDTWRALRSQLGMPIVYILWRPVDGNWKEGSPKAPWEIRC